MRRCARPERIGAGPRGPRWDQAAPFEGSLGSGGAGRRALLLLLLVLLAGTGCARRRPRASLPPPRTTLPATVSVNYVEEGLASWYGVPYHGRRAANGEIYDMHKLTAAHRTLPFETVVRVTNLRNGRKTEVRINDRGPFVERRVIDLSLEAARQLDMVAAGVAPVRLEVVSGADLLAGSFTVQVGAFEVQENARKLRRRLERRYQPVFIHEYDSPNGLFYRVRVGRVPSIEAAKQLAHKLRQEEKLVPFVVRLD